MKTPDFQAFLKYPVFIVLSEYPHGIGLEYVLIFKVFLYNSCHQNL